MQRGFSNIQSILNQMHECEDLQFGTSTENSEVLWVDQKQDSFLRLMGPSKVLAVMRNPETKVQITSCRILVLTQQVGSSMPVGCPSQSLVWISNDVDVGDGSQFSHLKSISIQSPRLTNEQVEKLPTLRIMNLSYNPLLTQVSCNLANVYHLDLSHTSITSVNALTNVHTLNLSNCTGITDVSALTGVHNVNLSGCTSLASLKGLENAHTVDISGCILIDNVQALQSASHITMDNCVLIRRVNILANAHTIIMRRCHSVTSISALQNVHHLDLRECSMITESEIQKVKQVPELFY